MFSWWGFLWNEHTLYQTKSHQENLKMWKSSKWQFRQTERNILDSPKVNVWCCLIRDRVIGPYFLKRKLSNSITVWTCCKHFVFPNWTEIPILKCFFPTRRGPAALGPAGETVSGSTFSLQVDWEGWTPCLASKIPGSDAPQLLPMGVC